MRKQGHQIFVDELTRFAAGVADQRVAGIAQWVGAPLRVAVHGRPGVGCRTVARALDNVGSSVGITVARHAGAADADIDIYVIAEVVKPEDCDALAAARRPVLVVLNKADLTGCLSRGAGSSGGPIAASRGRCAHFSKLVGVPVEPMVGLLAAALDDFDECLGEDWWDGLLVLAAHSGAAASLEGSFDGFLASSLPVSTEVRSRLLDSLDLFGTALIIAAVQRRWTAAQVCALLRWVSGIDAVVDKIVAIGAEVRYRRVLDAVAELEALAVLEKEEEGIGEFLSRDGTVVARMAVAVDLAQASGLKVKLEARDDPTAYLPRAVRWQRYSRGPVSDLHRACAVDITRGSLRLWSRAGGGVR